MDGKKLRKIGNGLSVGEGKWIGGKVGLLKRGRGKKKDGGLLEVEWIDLEK